MPEASALKEVLSPPAANVRGIKLASAASVPNDPVGDQYLAIGTGALQSGDAPLSYPPARVFDAGAPTGRTSMAAQLDPNLDEGNRVLRAVTTPAALCLLAALVLGSGYLTWQHYHQPCVPTAAASPCVGVSPESATGPLDNQPPAAEPPAEAGVPAVQPGQPAAPNGQPPVGQGPAGGNGGAPAQLPPGPAEQPGVANAPGANPAPPPAPLPPMNPVPPGEVPPGVVPPPPPANVPTPPGVVPPVNVPPPPPVLQGQPPVQAGQAPAQQGQQPIPVWGGSGCLFKARDDPSCWTMQTYGPDGHLTPVNAPVAIPPEYGGQAPAQVNAPPSAQVNAPPPAQVNAPPPAQVNAPPPAQVNAPPVVTPPKVSAPVVTPPKPSAPVVTPPKVSAPVVSPPKVSAPVVTPAKPSAPVMTPPKPSAPVVTQPEVSAPVVTPPKPSAPVSPPKVTTPIPTTANRTGTSH